MRCEKKGQVDRKQETGGNSIRVCIKKTQLVASTVRARFTDPSQCQRKIYFLERKCKAGKESQRMANISY